MPYRRTPRVEAHLRASRDRILAAALAIVAEQGYAGCSVAAVARRAGMATGSVYRHFPAKDDLVAEVFRVASQREVDAFARAAALEGSAAEAIAAVIETFAGRALRAPRLAYALLAEPADPAVDAERLVFRRAYAEVFARIVARGVAAGELPPQDVGVSAAALVGAVGEALVGPLAAGASAPDSTAPDSTAGRPAPATPTAPPIESAARPKPAPANAPPPPAAPANAPSPPAGSAGSPVSASAGGTTAAAMPTSPATTPPATSPAPPATTGRAGRAAAPAGHTIAHLITFAQRSIGAVP